jgi:hypothetical protein
VHPASETEEKWIDNPTLEVVSCLGVGHLANYFSGSPGSTGVSLLTFFPTLLAISAKRKSMASHIPGLLRPLFPGLIASYYNVFKMVFDFQTRYNGHKRHVLNPSSELLYRV